MPVILFIVIAIAVAVLGVYLAMRIGLSGRGAPQPPPGEPLPSTPLQRLARWALALGAAPAAAAAWLVIHFGPVRFDSDAQVRLPLTALILASVVACGFAIIRMHALAARDDGTVDERDRAILGRACAAQSVAMLLVLAAWAVGLTEAYHATRQVPTVFLNLIFWSCLIANLLAQPVGILFGYRRA